MSKIVTYTLSAIFCLIILNGKVGAVAVAGLELAAGFENFVYLNSGTSFTVQFTYTAGDAPTLNAELDTGTSLTGTVNTNTLTGTVSVQSTVFSGASLEFGTYLLTLNLSNTENVQSKEMVVFYEEQIEGFQVTTDHVFVAVDEVVQFDVTFTKGSNVELEWFLDSNDTCLIEYFGILRSTYKNHTFSTAGEYNVTVIAANTISRTLTSLLVTVQNKINGFTIINNEGPLNAASNVPFTIYLNTSALLPMGGIFVNLSYGDGQTDSVDLQSLISTMQSTGHTVNHQYTLQGNYTVTIVIYNEIDSVTFTRYAYIWNNLFVYLTASSVFAKVNDPITFQFANTPSTGFQYLVDYGDGNTTENSSTEILYETYSLSSWTYSYSTSGVFAVRMSTWNLFYVSNHELSVTVQYPIPADITLTPTVDEIPMPDGVMTFTLEMTVEHPSPTNVTCTFDYGDYEEVNVTTDFVFGSPVTKVYTYTTAGTKTVVFTCQNGVSSMVKTASVIVRAFTLNDFNINHDLIVGMNMTDENTDPSLQPRPVNVPVDVPFQVSLFSVSRFPPGITFTWNFGDGTTVESGLITEFYKNHTFTQRGTFSVNVVISDTSGNTRSITLHIQLGVITFQPDVTKGEVATTTFTYTASGVVGGSYTFSLFPGDAAAPIQAEPATRQYVYPNWGVYFPYVTGTNGSFTETVYSNVVYADFYFANLYTETNDTVYSPPGDARIVVKLPLGSQIYPNVTCRVDFDDFVDNQIITKSQNISGTEHFAIDYVYKSLNEHKLQINCSNALSEFTNATTIIVTNECFKVTGIFDRQYSSKTNPMMVSTSANVDLANRMPVLCPNENPRYDWEFFKIEGDNETVYHKVLPADTKGTVRFAIGETPEGLYKAKLNISLNGANVQTWISEFTYLKFSKAPPYVFISGGSQKTSKIAVVSVNALDESYDTEGGYGKNGNLQFNWTCHRFNTTTLVQLEALYNNEILPLASGGDGIAYLKQRTGDSSYCNSLLTPLSHGKVNLDATSVDFKGYIIIAEACVSSISGPQCSSFMQMIQTLFGSPPDVKIACQINCKEKYAVTSLLNIRALCNDCDENERQNLTYYWRMKAFNPVDSSYTYYSDSQLMVMSNTGLKGSSFGLKPNVLTPGSSYIISVTVACSITRGASGEGTFPLRANYPPYGGTCYGDPLKGNATTTPFNFICRDWADEGKRSEQNFTIDGPAKEPLNYQFNSIIKKMFNNVPEEVSSPLFIGSESTATEILMSVGDQYYEYEVIVLIKIIDIYGDFTYTNLTVKVLPDMSMIPSSPDDTAALDNMMSVFSTTFEQVDAGGNEMAAVQVIATTASIFTSSLVNLPQDNVTVASSDDILKTALMEGGDLTALAFEVTESPVTIKLKEITQTLTSTLLSKIPDVSIQNGSALNPADVTTVVKSMEACVSNPTYINDQTITNVAQASVMLMENLIANVEIKPFKVETIESMNEAIGEKGAGMVGMLETTLDALIPDSLSDLNAEVTTESVEQEYEDFILFNNIDLSSKTEAEKTALKDKIVNMLKQQKEREREEQRQKMELAKTAVPKMLQAIETAQRAKAAMMELGQPEEIITKSSMEISVKKAKFSDFLNSTTTRREFLMSFDNTSEVTEMQVWMTYFKKPVHIYGEGSSSITSPALKVNLNTIGGNHISEPLTLKVSNGGVAHFKRYQPLTIPGDPDEMIYFIYELGASDHATLFYLKPDTLNFDSSSDLANAFSSGNFELYVLYARDEDMPRVSNHDYQHDMNVRDWSGTYGFKVFISPQFEKGKAYIALKPKKSTNALKRRKRSIIEQDYHGSYLNFAPGQNRKLFALNDTTTDSLITPAAPTAVSKFEPANVNFSVIIVTTGCRMWDDATSAWVSNGCTVLELSTLNETICRCPNPPYGAVFATTFYVPPNTIDFSTVFSKFDASNAAVYGTCIALIVIYFLALIWARREDKKDLTRWATYFLCDSDESDEYFYVITVHTGLRRGAGTKSNVNFVVAGEEMDSGVRILSDGIREGFETSSVTKFFMGTSQPLGDLTYLRIWHDSSGQGVYESWYLHKIFIDDPQANKRYVFQCDNWLALQQGDGCVERLLPVCGRENLVTFEKLFSGHARFNLTESHIWLSLVMRPEKSTFSRVHRLSCILALLFLTMIASAMFFRSSSDDVSPNQVQIGFLKFSLTTVYISFISIIITTPPILIVSLIFKKAKPAEVKNKKLKEKMQKNVEKAFKEQDAKTMMKNNSNFSEEFYKDTNHPLPHWTVYIAWVIIFLAVVTSAFFLILYSMQWGKPKAEEWLFSFFFSFVESLVVVDPVKVILIAILFAVIFKKPMDEFAQDVDLEKVQEAAKSYNNGASRNYLNLRMDVLSKNEPPPASQLEKMREQRKKEMEAHRVFFELLLYLLYVFVLYSISYVNRDQRSFLMKTNIADHLVKNTKTQLGFSKVTSTQIFFTWMDETLFPNYFPLKEFNGVDNLGVLHQQFFSDMANARIGPARLRQVRTKYSDCPYQGVTPERHGMCVDNYVERVEDTNQYCLSWTPYNTSCPYAINPGMYYTADAWKFTKSSDIWGVPITGKFNTYGGGGYILKFEKDLDNSRRIINELKKHKWIDRGTRAIFLEFTLYNANANLFAYCIFLVEFTELGGLITWDYIQTFRPYQTTGALGTYVMACYFIFIIVLIMTTVKVIKKLMESKFAFFKKFWNCLDFICVVLSYIAIAMWVIRLVYATKSISLYYDDKDAFINFQHVVVWDFTFNIILAILVFVGTLRILRVLGYNKRMTQLADVLAVGGPNILAFLFILGIVFFAYVCLGFLIFGSYVYDYRSLFISFGSLANTLIGKNSLDSMVSAAPAFAQFYFFTYVFLVILTLMTMFAAILNQSISDVRLEVNKYDDTYGIVDILTGTLRDVLGIAFTVNSGKKNGKGHGKNKNKYQPKPGQNPEIDAPNILRLVRETFGELGDSEENPDEKNPKAAFQKKLNQIQADMDKTYGNRSMSRAYTPRDIDIMMDDFENRTDKMYKSYL